MDQTQSPNLKGYWVALISAAILSTTAVFIRYLTVNYLIQPLVLAFWRNVIVTLTLFIFFRITKPTLLKIQKQNLLFYLIFGLVLTVFNALWTFSVALNGAAVSTVLVYTSAAFTVLLGWWILKESISWAKIAAVIICILGAGLVAEALRVELWQTRITGVLVGVMAGLSYAIYSLFGRAAAQRGMNTWTSLFYTFLFASFYLFFGNIALAGWLPGAANTIPEFFILGKSLAGWGTLIFLAAGPTLMGFGFYNKSLALLPSSIVNLIATSEPIFTSIIAFIFLGESMTISQYVGGFLIMGGVLIIRLYEGKKLKETQKIPQSQII
ncbi:MAG: EamA family transporter [Chloroflexi bacterium HGW-Chloroflexi-10]|nr:MAG: EamA family transporter [Chloroflexi bacterium HGW-Chloroflexi-10]